MRPLLDVLALVFEAPPPPPMPVEFTVGPALERLLELLPSVSSWQAAKDRARTDKATADWIRMRFMMCDNLE
jgi:hypothetical protein